MEGNVMKQPPTLIKSILQKDNCTFQIQWSDGAVNDYRLSSLQKNCPCANCYDASERKQKVSPKMIDENVRATQITNVGRYALRIRFTSGCSMGIFSFALLRELASREPRC
jgi:DUF971 family protein